MKKVAIILFILGFVFACAPPEFKPFKPEPIHFEKTLPFSIQEELDKIPKPEPIKRIYVKMIDDETFKLVTNKEEATHITLSPEEYAKVGALVKLIKTYKGTIKDLERLVNIKIITINDLKEMVAMSELKSQKYYELWVVSENAYRYEKWEHDWDNRIHKAGLYGITIGSIVVFLLLL
jgi:hypothetical protein